MSRPSFKIEEANDSQKKANLWRERKQLSSPQQPRQIVDGQSLLTFCSNDYLGLACDKQLVGYVSDNEIGYGAGSSHLVNGHFESHENLEKSLAEFFGYEACLTFSSGYMANVGVIAAIAKKGDLVLQDKLNHASLIDGGKLSDAKMLRYHHNDLKNLEQRLIDNNDQATLVVTDGVFSMDGDIAPLKEISALCEKYNAMLMVDDAHGVGMLGDQGRGSLSHFGLTSKDVPIMVGTMGKSLGTTGAFVLANKDVINYLVQFCRTYIYTTATPPKSSEITSVALKLLAASDEKRTHLNKLISYFKSEMNKIGMELLPSNTAIQPIIIGEAKRALEISNRLKQLGILVTAIRPPTVPVGTSRLRITLTAAHSFKDVDQLINAFKEIN